MSTKQNLIGFKFGKLTVLSEVLERKNGRIYWLCMCDCGKQKEVAGRLLKNGSVTSCGCLINKHKIADMKGLTFGRLTVRREAVNRKNDGHVAWYCDCACGGSTIVSGNSLRLGQTTSCGCLARELAAKRFSTHRKSNTRAYMSWLGMKRRCYYRGDISYVNYGARGISVCAEWTDSFDNFYKDMGERPKGMSIDRINNDGNYCLDNCKWSTYKEQANNRRIRQ